MIREMLRPRREAITMNLRFTAPGGVHTNLSAAYGFDGKGSLKEVFCLPSKTGTDLQALVHQSCIAISLGLQHGMSMSALARAAGEDDLARNPRSIVGLIMRAGAKIEAETIAAKQHLDALSEEARQTQRRNNDQRESDQERPAGDKGNSGGSDHTDIRRLLIASEERAKPESYRDPRPCRDRLNEGSNRDGAECPPAPEGLVLQASVAKTFDAARDLPTFLRRTAVEQ